MNGLEPLVKGLAWYVGFVLSVVLHEAGHAWAARRGGDPTAYEGGQVSLDPRPHIRREPFGMVVLPLLSLAVAGWPLGFASAPYDAAWADRHPRRAAWMSLAGPAANLALVLLAASILAIGLWQGALVAPERAFVDRVAEAREPGLWASAAFVLSIFFSLNLILLVFNLLPLPPLDGAGAVGLLLPEAQARALRSLQGNAGFAVVGMLAAWYGFRYVFDPIFSLALNLLHPGAGYH